MASNFKNPPKFDPKTMSYETWKNEVAVWQLVTELPDEKQALAVSLSLSGNARETAMNITAADMAKKDGMQTILRKLDEVFLKDDKDKAYEAYRDFDSFKRPEDTTMNDYIIEFDRRYNISKKYDMTLPEAVLTFKILDNAGLTSKERQLALTASPDLKYASMKSALKRIFSETGSVGCTSGFSSPNAGITVKEEKAFMTRQNKSAPNQRQQGYQRRAERGTNPLNKYGKRTKCAICESVFHWAKNCPEKGSVNAVENENENTEDCNLTLLTKEPPNQNEIFVMEAKGAAVIDTACTRTVCGEKWFNQYMACVNKETVDVENSQRPFKFGDGKVVESFKRATIPATIGKTQCKIETEIVKSDIPLLLSKASLKRAETVLDLKNDEAKMFNEPVKLDFTSSGHYCVNILPAEESNELQCAEDEILTVDSNMSDGDKRRTLTKLHKQFGHASANRLTQLLKSAGTTDAHTLSMLQKITDDCEICASHKKPVARPVVGLPLASEYNETVAVDLHELEPNKVWYLHIIDEFTRFSAGCIMRSKRASEFVKKFLEVWISVHGAPKRLYSDNGGEFNNEEVRDMAENFNIEVKTTAAYSPWSNGLLERHNETLTEVLLKVKEDHKCDWDTALHWALMTKNAMHNVHGYSPYQLVFGRNPNLPSVLIDKLPALEGTTMSDTVGKHIAALHASKTAFTQSECSERIRRALRKQTRSNGDQRYYTGDKVYYRRPDSKEWKGPGTVIGQDGAVVFVRHGGIYVRVHQCRLTRANVHEQHMTKEGVNENERKEAIHVRAEQHINEDPKDLSRIHSSDSSEGEHEGSETLSENNELEPVRENMDEQRDPEPDHQVIIGQNIKYTDSATGEQCVAQVIGRAGKAKGKNKTWYNLRYSEPESMKDAEISADLSKIEGLDLSDLGNNTRHEEDEDTVMVIENESFINAKHKELESWAANDVYTEQTDCGQKCISTRWICTLKETPEGLKAKARLVARGFEDPQVKEIPKDSPTCNTESMRLILAIIAQKKWSVNTMDIKTAFLQGSELTRDIFVKPPPEASRTGKVWKLRKCIYGLADASLNWYNRVKDVMEQSDGEISHVDPAVFYWKDKERNVKGILACHVDDFLWAGSQEFENSVVNGIRSTFAIGREVSHEDGAFPYIGIELSNIGGVILLSQKTYIKNLNAIPVDKERMMERDEPVTSQERDALQSKIGQILWVARQSRPDVIFDASSLAASFKNATVRTLIEANKVIKNLQSETVDLKFQALGCDESLKMVIFSDSSLGNLSDGSTQGGHLIVLMGQNGRFSSLSWQSKKIRRVVRSTLAAETLAMADGIDSGIFLATLFAELTTGQAKPENLPIVCVTDNNSLCDAIQSTKSVNDKRLRLEISSIKEMIQSHQVRAVTWVDSKNQLADCLTKKGASAFGLLKALSDGVWWDKCLA